MSDKTLENTLDPESVPQDAEEQFRLGQKYFKGDGVGKDPAKAVELYRMAAEQGHAAAQFNLGSCFHNGEGVEKDYAQAVAWYKKAQESGFGKMAETMISSAYSDERDEKVAQERRKEQQKLEQAAAGGDVRAAEQLGRKCRDRNQFKAAVYWLKQPAALKDRDCLCLLGNIYVYDLKDPASGIPYLTKSSEAGSDDAPRTLGRLYRCGSGTEKDLSKAVQYFRIAYERNPHYYTAEEVGDCCMEMGDYKNAVVWYNKAISHYDFSYLRKRKAAAEEKLKEQRRSEKKLRRKDVLFEFLGIAAFAFFFVAKLFLAAGAGHNGVPRTIHTGFLTGTLLNMGCVGGLILLAAAVLACLTMSLFKEPISGGLIGGVAGLLFAILLGVHPVLLQYAFYAAIAFSAIFILSILRKWI